MRRAAAAALIPASLLLAFGLSLALVAEAQTQGKESSQQKAKPKPKAKAEEASKPQSKPSVSDQRYREAQELERKGEHRAALKAYLDAGNAGHGQAQRRLAEIYDRGTPAVKRDYDAALRWYEKARAQGVVVPKPHAFTKGR